MRKEWMRAPVGVLCLAVGFGMAWAAVGQQKPAASGEVERASVGDQPEDPGPLATDVSGKLTHKDVRAAAKKVADWELARTEATFNEQWTYAALYDGFLAASRLTGDAKYHDAMVRMGKRFDWKLLDTRFPHADDMAIGKVFMDLSLEDKKKEYALNTQANLDRLLVRPDDPSKLLWWWCDALYMAPPVLARMYVATHDKKYLDYMDKEWWETSDSLYNKEYHLYWRDASYFKQQQANGKPIFWSRGNGWVMGAFVLVLEKMPKDYPSRPKYIQQYKEMADEIASIQSKDGLWRTGLLDPDSYDLPEDSGSAFFVYSLAWGINQGILDKAKFKPVVEKGWAGLVSHIYADGRLGCIQPIGAAPGGFKASASYVFGVGGFLEAASEVDKLSK